VTFLKPSALSPVGLQWLSLSIDRPCDGAVMSQLSLVCRLFGQLTSLKLHHVHREEWPYLPLLADLKVSVRNYLQNLFHIGLPRAFSLLLL
jgi:hypothetical protein